ncbi:hypothetical protein AMTRI_Chr12g275210 [Amborella trichopoda]
MSSVDSFKRLVKLAARAFYDDISTKGDNQPKTGRSDNRGMADLKLHSKQLRRTSRFFEEEKFAMRDHCRETAKSAKVYNAALAATGDGQLNGNSEEKMKMNTHSYCCLDYALIYVIVRYIIHRMKKKLKDDMEDKNTIQKYECPNCKQKDFSLDALQLINMHDESFHCENCNAELVAESDKTAVEEMGDGDDNARQRMWEKLREELRVEVALAGVEVKEEDSKPDSAATVHKVLPSWMIQQGMNLTNEQRGEQEEQAAAAYSVASTSNVINGVSETQTERWVGMKVKQEYNEDEDYVEWKEATSSRVSSAAPKINDLNEEADASKDDDDEDEIDWEEG